MKNVKKINFTTFEVEDADDAVNYLISIANKKKYHVMKLEIPESDVIAIAYSTEKFTYSRALKEFREEFPC